jgi:hypothetical protein
MNELDELAGVRADLPPLSDRARYAGRERLAAVMAPATVPARVRPAGRPHRRLAAVALAAGVFGVAAGVGATLALTSPPRPAPAARQDGGQGVHVRTVAWSLDSISGSVVAVSLIPSDSFDPAGLQAALIKAGVPAVVRIGTCNWSPLYNADVFDTGGRDGTGMYFTIVRSAIPKNTEIVVSVVPPHQARAEHGPGIPAIAGEGSTDGSSINLGLAPAGSPVTCQ